MPVHTSDGGDSETGDGSGTRRTLRKQARLMSKTCETCKAKKSRCDSSRPQCDTCRRKGITCIYKERGQPGLRPGYGRAVEGRLSLLEDNMQKMSQSIQDVLRHVQTRPSSTNTSHGGGPSESPLAPTVTSADRGGLLTAWQPSPSSVPIAEPATVDQQQQSMAIPAYSAIQPPSVPLPLVDAAMNTMNTMDAMAAPLAVPLDPMLPPRAVLDELIELFFTHVYPLAPLFHRPTFQSSLYNNSNNNMSPDAERDDRQLLLHGMVVLGFRFWTKSAGAGPSAAERERYVRASREKLLVETINLTSLVAYQALALLAIDAMGDGPGPRTWNIMAMLVACARQLHLDHNPSQASLTVGGGSTRVSPSSFTTPSLSVTSPLVTNDDDPETETDAAGRLLAGLSGSAIEAEEKRRLFWTIYSLDRFSSVSLGQPCAIDRHHIRLQYPARDCDWGQSMPLAWFHGGGGGGGGGGGSGSLFAPMSMSTHTPTPMRGPTTTHNNINLWQNYIDILSLVDQSNQLLVQPMNLSLPAQCQEWQSKFRRLDVLSMTWLESLPTHLREPPSSFDPMWHIVHATFYLINIRMYTVASFPATSSPYMRPSPSARIQLRQSVEKFACLTATLQPDQVGQLGPLFAFVVWVAARSMIILWTTGHDMTSSSGGTGGGGGASSTTLLPADLATLLRTLNQSALYWPCAACYADIIQLILDANNSPGGPTGGSSSKSIDIFNDTRRTAYGLRRRLLGMLSSQHRSTTSDVDSHDDLFTMTDDFFDGVFAGLIDIPPVTVTPLQQFSFVNNPSTNFDGDWL